MEQQQQIEKKSTKKKILKIFLDRFSMYCFQLVIRNPVYHVSICEKNITVEEIVN